MAYNTLGIQALSAAPRRERSVESVLADIEISKRAVIEQLNFPGVEYYFDGGKLCCRLVNIEAFRDFHNKAGFSAANTEMSIDLYQSRQPNVYYDYDELCQRFVMHARAFQQITGGKYQKFAAVPIEVTHHNTINAGAMPLDDGTDIITINSGVSHLQQWFAMRNFYFHVFSNDDPFDFRIFYSAMTAPFLKRYYRGLVQRAGFIMGYPSESKVALQKELKQFGFKAGTVISHLNSPVYKAWCEDIEFLEILDQACEEHGLYQVPQRSHWLSAEIFVVLHEIGHIVRGHTDECRHWMKNPVRDERERRQRIERRREMEFEADHFAGGYVMAIKDFYERRPFRREYHANETVILQDFVNPMRYLFTIFEIGKPSVDRDAGEPGHYPSNESRLANIFNINSTRTDEDIKPMMVEFRATNQAKDLFTKYDMRGDEAEYLTRFFEVLRQQPDFFTQIAKNAQDHE